MPTHNIQARGIELEEILQEVIYYDIIPRSILKSFKVIVFIELSKNYWISMLMIHTFLNTWMFTILKLFKNSW